MPAYKEKNGTWMFRLYITDESGIRKQVKRRGFRTRAEALDAEKTFMLPTPITDKRNKITIYDIIEDFYNEKRKVLKITSFDSYRYRIEKYIVEYFKNMDLRKISSKDIQKWQNHLIEYNFTPAYINAVHNNLNSIFQYLVNFNYIASNPCVMISHIKDNKIKEQRNKICELDNFQKFINSFEEKEYIFKYLFETIYFSGLRISEARGLKWNYIDFDNHYIFVQTQFQNTSEGAKDVDVKSNKSYRKVYISKQLEDKLKEYKNIRKNTIDSEDIEDTYVFGFLSPIGKNTIDQQRIKHIKKADIPYFTNHDLRHTYGSTLLSKGFDIKFVSEQMGHDSIDVTLRIYHHILSNVLQQNVNKLYNF